MEPHRESTDWLNKLPQPSFHLVEQLPPGFSSLFFSGSDSVLYSKFLCHVFRRAVSLSVVFQPWRRPVERLVSLGCSLCDGLFIARSSGSFGRVNARNNEMKTSSSYFDVDWFPWSLVRGRISAPVDRRLHDRKQPHHQAPHKSAQPPFSVQYRGSKLSHETMKRRQVHQTLTSNDFHEALFVDAAYQRPSIDVCTIGNSPTLHTNLPNPHSLFN